MDDYWAKSDNKELAAKKLDEDMDAYWDKKKGGLPNDDAQDPSTNSGAGAGAAAEAEEAVKEGNDTGSVTADGNVNANVAKEGEAAATAETTAEE